MSAPQVNLNRVLHGHWPKRLLSPQLQRSLFDGATYDPALDADRLSKALGRVYVALASGGWWTLQQLAHAGQCSEAGAAARVRDLRKAKFGAYLVERRRRGDPKNGLHEYRLTKGL